MCVYVGCVHPHPLNTGRWCAIFKIIPWQPQVPWSLAVLQARELCRPWTLYLSGCSLCLYQSCKVFQEFLQWPHRSLSQGIVSCDEVVFAEYHKIIISRSHCLHFRNGNALTNKSKIFQYQNVRSVLLLLENHNKHKKEKPLYFRWSSPTS